MVMDKVLVAMNKVVTDKMLMAIDKVSMAMNKVLIFKDSVPGQG